jgi:hypothetical protein
MLIYTMITVIKGTNPVLLSAPHVYRHYRRNLDRVVKQGEPLTDLIAKQVAINTSSNLISVDMDTDYDPNYDSEKENEYKRKVRKVVKDSRVQLFIDIHGLSDRHSYDFAIFFPLRYTNSKKIAYRLAQELSVGPLRKSLIMVLNLKDDSQETLTEFSAQKLKIPSIQLEIARYIREDELLRNSVVEGLSRFLLNS